MTKRKNKSLELYKGSIHDQLYDQNSKLTLNDLLDSEEFKGISTAFPCFKREEILGINTKLVVYKTKKNGLRYPDPITEFDIITRPKNSTDTSVKIWEIKISEPDIFMENDYSFCESIHRLKKGSTSAKRTAAEQASKKLNNKDIKRLKIAERNFINLYRIGYLQFADVYTWDIVTESFRLSANIVQNLITNERVVFRNKSKLNPRNTRGIIFYKYCILKSKVRPNIFSLDYYRIVRNRISLKKALRIGRLNRATKFYEVVYQDFENTTKHIKKIKLKYIINML